MGVSIKGVRRWAARGDTPGARAARSAYQAVMHFHLPAPRVIVRPLLVVYLALRSAWYFVFRVFVCEPFFKASCARYGRNLTTGVYTPWILGGGDVIVGDDCNVVGKLHIVFANRYAERPTLRVGDRTGLGHNCQFTVAISITIGDDCHIAGGTRMFDTSGHPLDPVKRLAGLPAEESDVKPITIGNNVWIGAECVIFPGVNIGDNSVVATGSVVTGDVPASTFVAGFPARMVRRFD
jgi:acetyltransferase-like isoleucine patch superfamily enzyme